MAFEFLDSIVPAAVSSLPAGTGSGAVLRLASDGELYEDWQSGQAWRRVRTAPGAGSGDMLKATYDTTNNGVVDNAEALGGVAAANYVRRDTSETFNGVLSAGAGSLAFRLLAGSAFDHVYMGFFARQNSGVRSAYFGFPGDGATELALVNELAGGTIALSAAGGVTVGGQPVVVGNDPRLTGNQAPVRLVTTNYTVTASDSVIYANAAAGPITITLPAVSVSNGAQAQRVEVKKYDTSANAVTVIASGGLIDGAANAILDTPYDAYGFSPVPGTADWGGF